MTNIFQPLDLTVNGSAKSFMKRRFTEWYSAEIGTALDEGIQTLDDIEIKLSVLKPLHASWLVELFNYMTSDKGRQVVENRRLLALLKHLRKALMVSNHWIPSLLLIH